MLMSSVNMLGGHIHRETEGHREGGTEGQRVIERENISSSLTVHIAASYPGCHNSLWAPNDLINSQGILLTGKSFYICCL